MKKIFISLIAATLIVVTLSGCSSNNDNASQNNEDEFKIALVDEKDNSKNNDNDTITIDEEETPKATITKNTSVKNLTTAQLNTIRTSLFNSVNSYRKKNSKKTVTKNATLQKTADIRAKEIVKKWSHTRPSGKSWTTVLTSNGISNKNLKAGENLAKITATAKSSYSSSYITQIANALHTSLINSSTHRSVMLDKNYTKVGVGIYSEVKNGKVTVYIVQHYKN